MNAGHGRPTTREVRAALRTPAPHWKTGSDPDGTHEPLLDVSSFNIGSDFEISSTPQVKLATGGGSPSFDIWLARLGGSAARSTSAVVNSTLPNGANANVNENASGLARGAVARVTINLPGSVAAGTYDIRFGARTAAPRGGRPCASSSSPQRTAVRGWTSAPRRRAASRSPFRSGGRPRRELPASAQPKRRILGNDRQHRRHQPQHDRMARQPLPVPRQIGQRPMEVRGQLAGRTRVPARGRQPDGHLVARCQLQLLR